MEYIALQRSYNIERMITSPSSHSAADIRSVVIHASLCVWMSAEESISRMPASDDFSLGCRAFGVDACQLIYCYLRLAISFLSLLWKMQFMFAKCIRCWIALFSCFLLWTQKIQIEIELGRNNAFALFNWPTIALHRTLSFSPATLGRTAMHSQFTKAKAASAAFLVLVSAAIY